MKRRSLIVLFAACLASGHVAAQPTGDEPNAEAPPAKAAALPRQDLTPRVLFQFLLAEVAARRGQIDVAVDAYRDLVQGTRDPRIAQRAAQMAVFARRYDAALEFARLWAETDPESPQARQMVTSLMSAGGRPDELADYISRQLAAETMNRPALLLQLNRALARIPDRHQVLTIVDRVTEPYVGLAEAHFARAVAAHAAQESMRAVTEAERALELRPDWEPPALLLGQLLPRSRAIIFLQGFAAERGSLAARQSLARLLVAERRYAEAQSEFLLLLAAMPDDPDTIYALGVLAYQLGDPVAAERHFRRILEFKHPEADAVRLYLGQIAEDAKRWDEALKWYGEINTGEPWVSAQLRHAGVLTKRGSLDSALRFLQAARATHAEHAFKLLMGEAQLLRDAGRTADAFALLDEGLAQHPDQPELLYESALMAERLGRIDTFESRLRQLLRLKPDHAHAYNALGYSLVDRNTRLDEAQGLIDKALALAPDDPFILDSKGWVLFRRGELPAALEALQRAFSLRPDPEIAAHLGEVLWTLGRKDEAQKTWRDAARAHPGNEVLTATIKRFQP